MTLLLQPLTLLLLSNYSTCVNKKAELRLCFFIALATLY
jgi:hypothetical protein